MYINNELTKNFYAQKHKFLNLFRYKHHLNYLKVLYLTLGYGVLLSGCVYKVNTTPKNYSYENKKTIIQEKEKIVKIEKKYIHQDKEHTKKEKKQKITRSNNDFKNVVRYKHHTKSKDDEKSTLDKKEKNVDKGHKPQ